MIVKALNTYRIIHKDGTTEDINADTPFVALSNMTVTEEESPVISLSMLSSEVRTVIEEPETEPDDLDEDNENEETTDNTTIGGEIDFGEGN